MSGWAQPPEGWQEPSEEGLHASAGGGCASCDLVISSSSACGRQLGSVSGSKSAFTEICKSGSQLVPKEGGSPGVPLPWGDGGLGKRRRIIGAPWCADIQCGSPGGDPPPPPPPVWVTQT